MRDFSGIHKAVELEGEVEEPKDVTPHWESPPRKSAIEQIRADQEVQRAKMHRNSILAGRYLVVGAVLALVGICWYGPPAWLRDGEFWIGVLLVARGMWCWEMAGASRAAASWDPTDFLSSPDR